MDKRGIVLESLMTYGVTILVVLVVTGATLTHFGVLKPEMFLPEKCVINPASGLYCEDASADVDGISLRIQNLMKDDVKVVSIDIIPKIKKKGEVVCSSGGGVIPKHSRNDFFASCSLEPGDKIKADLDISYESDGFGKTATGTLVLYVPGKKPKKPKENKTCSDSTVYSECSITKPKYCDEGILIDDCQVCGCPENQECQEDGNCISICPDRTQEGNCSITKPKYCENGFLIDNCQICGCDTGKECQNTGECLSLPSTCANSCETAKSMGEICYNGRLTASCYLREGESAFWYVNTGCFGNRIFRIKKPSPNHQYNMYGYMKRNEKCYLRSSCENCDELIAPDSLHWEIPKMVAIEVYSKKGAGKVEIEVCMGSWSQGPC